MAAKLSIVSEKHRDHRSRRQVVLCLMLWSIARLLTAIRCDGVEVDCAYIGPGAGIALVSSFFAVFFAVIAALGAIMAWPIRRVWRTVRGRKALRAAKVKRVVILGLDGLEPALTDRFLEEGRLPNLARLAEQGTYKRLGTTCPPLSPVAWSSFTTGTNPGKHNIFDFITRNPVDYRPKISSVRIAEPRRKLKLGRFVVPLSKPSITGLRKSKPFWSVLGEAGIFSAVLRVPITFPPDRFHGVQLSAMCVPDLLGSQGTFLFYTDNGAGDMTMDSDVGGTRIVVQRRGDRIDAALKGPFNTLRADQPEAVVPFSVEVAKHGPGDAVMRIDGQRLVLEVGRFTDWVRVSYRLAPGVRVRGVCRFYLKRFDDRFELYCTPVQIDPDKPVMPISHPTVYSSYLARQQGTFATLGLAEDTWSLSERIMSEDAFLEQVYGIQTEREMMFLDSLDRVRRGLVACVFDAPDRIQHMFWRFIDEDHPALRGKENTHAEVIRDMYVRMDELVGKTIDKLDDDSTLFVMSDHGFKPFRRGVDLNAWLVENGYLKLKNGAVHSGGLYLSDVDWTATTAYAIGLTGIFINVKGREAQGIVDSGDERQELVKRITSQLSKLKDPQTGEVAIYEVIPRNDAYTGPYVDAAPDLIIGYNVGFRVSWDAAVGNTGEQVFSDNTKAWSGDHCIHPALVPGVLFSNRKLSDGGANIIDLAPTVLDLLGVAKPAYMEGESLL